MSNLIPNTSAVHTAAKVSPNPLSKTPPAPELREQTAPKGQPSKAPEHHSQERYQGAGEFSSTEVSYVRSLMGLLPAQKMGEVMLRTGIPMPANLGQDIDTSV